MPEIYREKVLSRSVAWRDGRALADRKTYYRILNHFFCPGIKSDAKRFVRKCFTCQTAEKNKHKIALAPLQPLPNVKEQFSSILIDIVGSLPKTKSWHQSLLILMYKSTRFIKAKPLRKALSKIIIQIMTSYFLLVGFPKMIRADQGKNLYIKFL